MTNIILTIFGFIGFFQVIAFFLALGFSLGRAQEINKWKLPDFFYMKRMEDFIVKLLTK